VCLQEAFGDECKLAKVLSSRKEEGWKGLQYSRRDEIGERGGIQIEGLKEGRQSRGLKKGGNPED
jgi:hypothetical protein